MSAKVGRPSDARRAALSGATDMGEKGVPLVSNMFSLDRYYSAAEMVLTAFYHAYEESRLDDAYVYGKRFAIFSLNGLPAHNYYNSPKYAKARIKNQQDMADVVRKLEQVAKWMDLEEMEKEKQRRRQEAERKRREEERLRQEAEEARLRLMQFQKDIQAANQNTTRKDAGNVEQSALDKLRKLQGGPNLYDLNEGVAVMDIGSDSNDAYMNDLLSSFSRRDGRAPGRQTSQRTSSRQPGQTGGCYDTQMPLQGNGTDEGSRRFQRRRSSGSNSGSSDSQGSVQGRSGDEGSRRFQRRGSHDLQRRDSNEPEGLQVGRNSNTMQRRGSYSPKRLATNDIIQGGESRHLIERRGSGDLMPLPPPMAPPSSSTGGFPPPPSYNSVVDRRYDTPGKPSTPTNNQSAQFPLSVLEQAAANAAAAAGGVTTRRGQSVVRDPFPPPQIQGNVFANRELEKQQQAARKEKVPFRVIKQHAAEKYAALRGANRIHVINIATHQGRYSHSTNGCAVISPLVVSHHLRSRSAVADEEIVAVIDRECGPLLREVRGKLGLGGDALIIPSDVHDYLVDKKLLSQEAFVGAAGGNIMDPQHLAEFLRLIDSGEKNSHINKRTGAALFFREHVVSIVKVPLTGGKWCYDLIDSLPGSNGQASRTRCRDLPALEAYVRYYASAKLSESNCSFIDNNDWNDMMADFDPRVFQGFVWGDR